MSTPPVTSDRWSQCLHQASPHAQVPTNIVVGVLPGEGIGQEVIACAVEVLNAVACAAGVKVQVTYGGAIGRDAERIGGAPLSAEVIEFCERTFQAGGAILCGPGGGRFVYDLRRRFDLFCKISPIRSCQGFPISQRFQQSAVRDVDILIVREGRGGCYQGVWGEGRDSQGRRTATQTVCCTEHEVQRFVDAAARLARFRRGRLTVVWKESGVPSISALWRDCADAAATAHGIECRYIDVDFMAYQLIQDAADFDVIAAPNLFGDVLSDLGAVFLGSRGNSYSGNFNSDGHAVYQTNHGAAYDLVGKDSANPVGQVLSMAMMLRESFGLKAASVAVENAVRHVWESGYCTADFDSPQHHVIGTREMGSRIAQRVVRSFSDTNSDGQQYEAVAGSH